MEIRRMEVQDVPKVMALLASGEGVVVLDWETPELVASFVERCPGHGFVATEGDEIIGCVFITDGLRGALQHLFVKEEYRGLDIGSALVKAILAEFVIRTGTRRVHAVVASKNQTGLLFWLSLGFRKSTAEGGRVILLTMDLPG